MEHTVSRARRDRLPLALLVLGASALIACTGGPTVTSGEGDGESSGERGEEGDGRESSGDPSSSNRGGGSSEQPSGPAGSDGSEEGDEGSSSSSGSSGSTAPRAECVAWANRHCSCLEAVNAARPDCRTKSAAGCEDGVSLCPKQLAWYTCSQVTCGNTCAQPDC
ncbi:MAG: hypothetical protein KF850_35025 [Labilithrix sp.]|nr:hypothetical protein [Labilithrix sp.]